MAKNWKKPLLIAAIAGALHWYAHSLGWSVPMVGTVVVVAIFLLCWQLPDYK